MTDKELLEKAAKAAGIEIRGNANKWIAQGVTELDLLVWNDKGGDSVWNPLTDDGDALRLAVKLNLDITHSWSIVYGDDKYPMASIHVSYNNRTFVYELKEADPYAATRRAIVRAAAEIGKTL